MANTPLRKTPPAPSTRSRYTASSASASAAAPSGPRHRRPLRPHRGPERRVRSAARPGEQRRRVGAPPFLVRRSCRMSPDHAYATVRMLIDPDADYIRTDTGSTQPSDLDHRLLPVWTSHWPSAGSCVPGPPTMWSGPSPFARTRRWDEVGAVILDPPQWRAQPRRTGDSRLWLCFNAASPSTCQVVGEPALDDLFARQCPGDQQRKPLGPSDHAAVAAPR